MNKSIYVWSRGHVIFLIVSFLFCGWVRTGLAEEYRVDLQELVNETQKSSNDGREMTFVWWIPEEYWRISFAQSDPPPTREQAEEFIKVLEPYTLIVVAEGRIGKFGWDSFKSESDIRSSIRLVDNRGSRYHPISEDKINPDTRNFLSMMKPVLANMVGIIGHNMYFYAFQSKDKGGRTIAEGVKDGSFSVSLGKKVFRWRLPLSSLFPKSVCSNCGEKVSGAYKYCPWDGTKLSEPKRDLVRK